MTLPFAPCGGWESKNVNASMEALGVLYIHKEMVLVLLLLHLFFFFSVQRDLSGILKGRQTPSHSTFVCESS